MQKTGVWSLGREDHLEKSMATHSSIPAWSIPWTEEPGGVGYDPSGCKELDTTVATVQAHMHGNKNVYQPYAPPQLYAKLALLVQ